MTTRPLATSISPAPSPQVPLLLRQEIHLLRLLRTRLWPGRHGALIEQLDQAVLLARCPQCAEAQADGVPCDRVDADCARCARALLRIRELRTTLQDLVGKAEGTLPDPLDL